MRSIRNFGTLIGLSVMLLALGVTGAKAQGISTANLTGKFTLPIAAQWGTMILPAGEYTLVYGHNDGGQAVVQVRGTAKRSSGGMVVAVTVDQASPAKDALICVREGDALVVRSLDLSTTGKSVKFAMPHGTRLMARNGNHNRSTQLAEAQIPVEFNKQ